MKNIAIACNTLKDEVKLVAADLKVDYPILWIDSGLHNVPERLNNAIQDQINRLKNVQNIILLFGKCGNSLNGLLSPDARIIFPKVDDCISMFLKGNKQRKKNEKEEPSYFFTKGYLENESNIWSEYIYCSQKYGENKANMIFKRMLSNYKKLRVIDTGAYDLEEILEETEKIAQQFKLKHEVIKGSLKILYKALSCQWDHDFAIVEPGQQLSNSNLEIT